MESKQLHRRRLLIRLGLGWGVLASLTGLLAVARVGPFSPDAKEPPALSRSQDMHVRITDERGRRLDAAALFALRPRDGGAVTERWKPRDGILSVPAEAGASEFLVGARGYRLETLRGGEESRTLKLRRGIRLRVSLRNAPDEFAERNIRFLLRLRPVERNVTKEGPGLDTAALVDLMDNVGRPGSGPRDLPRGKFGYAVSRVQAHAGILVPAPGRYYVHWGLMDLVASTWFSLGAPCGRRILVRDRDDLQVFTLDVTEGNLQLTLDGLRTSIRRIGED